jgi:3-oxoacyl-[acyl-carrier-protein] synthase III
MGTRIDAAATEVRRGRWRGRGALHLIDAAATACLTRAHHRGDELDLLINTGIYKDGNIAEPALASIIQEDLGANLGHPPRLGHHGTFSFDIANGGCGVITAAQLADGFVQRDAAHLALIVAGDADPSPRTTRGFRFAPAGGAMLLEHDDGDTGFVDFAIRTFPEDAALFEARMRWDPEAGRLRKGRNVVEIDEAPGFAARCVEHGVEVARELVTRVGLSIESIDLLIASQYPPRFGLDVARGLGISEDRVPHVRPELERTHTAGPIASLEAAIASGQFIGARHTLFVTAGAGITIGAAIYRAAD